jgi:hypothetical protein
MRNLMLSRILFVFVLLTGNSHANHAATAHQLELKVSELRVNDDLFPGAKSYSATLTNTTTQPIRVELIKMPEEPFTTPNPNGGVVYPCATQFWNAKTKTWRTIPPRNTRSDHSVGFYSHWDMKPNESIEVCRELLVKERIKAGKCARFAFTFHWDHKPDILSKPFVIPDPNKPSKQIQCPGSINPPHQ